MSAAYCEPLVETCFSSLPGSGGSVGVGGASPALSGWIGAVASGWIWFRCAYDGCHPGVGHVIIESKDGEILYDGCPTEGTRKLIWLDFPAAKLWEGGLMQVNYGLPGCSEAGHECRRATFEWGSYEDTANPLGVAYLDNAGGSNDLGNVCDGAALTIWRTISQGNIPNTAYLDISPGWEYLGGASVGAGNFPDYVVGPYDRDYWVFSGNLQVDDDLVIDGNRVFPDNLAGPIGAGNVFLKFLPRGGVARINVWNSGGSTGQNPGGALRLYESGSGSAVSANLSRCNAFVIPPQTIGAYRFKNAGGDALDGARKVFYRKGGLPDPVPCADAGLIPAGYVPKVSQATPQVTGGALTATASFLQVIGGLPGQVPVAKRALVVSAEYWRVKIFHNGSEMAGFYLALFFPSGGFQGGMIEIGAAIDYTDYYITETVRVGQTAALRLSYTPWGEPAIELSLQVDVAFVPV